MDPEVRLTPTSYIVLGLLDRFGPSTPYELKQLVSRSVGNFWTLNHAQLYGEPERLRRGGYLSEEREEGGRRRKRYSLTDRGAAAVRAWLATPPEEVVELREPGVLKLFFGAEPGPLAAIQYDLHRRKLNEYEDLAAGMSAQAMREGPGLALQAGMAHERAFIRFWAELAER